jgi:hypothetical protein
MNLKASLSLSILFVSIISLASPKTDNVDSHYMPCFAYIDYDLNGNPIVTDIKPANVTKQEWAKMVNSLIEKELVKKGITKKQLDRISKMQETEKKEDSILHTIPYDFATGLWHIGRGLFYLTYEVGKGWIWIGTLAGKHVIIPLSKASLYYVWQTLKSLLYTKQDAPKSDEPPILPIENEDPLFAIKNY